METTGFITVFVTVPSAEEANTMAKTLVQRRLAACVNIVPGITSHYWWKNSPTVSPEWLLIVKTREVLFDEVEAAIKVAGSYSVPDILALPIVRGSSISLAWMDKELKGYEERC